MKKIGIIFGSSRPSNKGEKVATWFAANTKTDDIEFEMIDLKEVNLPMFNEKVPPMFEKYEHQHTKDWSEKVRSLDGVVLVAAEYNRGPTPILKNAIDYLYNEWKEKPVALISYGAAPSSTAVEILQKIMAHIKAKVVSETVHVTPAHEAVTDDGVDGTKTTGDTPQVVLEKLLEMLKD